MADQKISALTTNPGIDGTEEMPTSRAGSNFKNTLSDLKIFIKTIPVVFLGSDFAGADYTNALLLGLAADIDFVLLHGNVLVKNTDYTFSGDTITLIAGAPAPDESFLILIF